MPVSAEPSSSSTTIGQHICLQRPRIHQTTRNLPPFVADDPLLIPKPNRIRKSAMSSFFLLPTSSNETTPKKPNGFPQMASSSSSFRGLGCTTASASHQVSVPAVIRSSADWDASNFKIKKTKSKKKNKGSYNGGSIKILSEASSSVGGGVCAAIPDVWCGPGVGFSTDAVVGGSIDPVESDPQRRNIPGRRKIDGDKNNSSSNNNSNQREGCSLLPRRSLNQETNPYFDSDSTILSSRTEQTLFSDRYHRHHLRQPYPDGFAEMMMAQNGFVMGGALSSHDHFRDLRLNVDNMSYEQLLELGERIGHVNTGLKENQIKICLKKVKPLRSQLADTECSICREEYEAKDSVGKLPCGHMFHTDCVKQWLIRKNSCPVCKTTPYVKS